MKQHAVIVIGGGVHGAGVLRAAAAAGHRAVLIEKRGLASGTSSESSKLIHGGRRSLQSGRFSLVRESFKERAIHLRIAAQLADVVKGSLKEDGIEITLSANGVTQELEARVLVNAAGPW